MRALKAQYFFLLAVSGSVSPFLSLYFNAHGLGEMRIGYIQGFASIAVILTPIFLTLLADSRLDARFILAGALTLAAAALGALHFVHGFVPILIIWTLHLIFYVPLSSLQDGITFSVMKRREELALPIIPYHRVRVWGSVGFMIPSVILFFIVRYSTTPILLVGAAFALAGAITAVLLPNPQGHTRDESPAAPSRLPTFAAANRMFRGPLLIFCIASFLLNAASAPFYTYYPLYLTKLVHIPQQWVGLIGSIGVFVEILFMLGFAKLLSRWGLKQMMIIGACCIAARMILLAAWPNPVIAIGTQLFHGMIVLMLLIAPPVYLNQHAEDRYRHSMQGLYAMLVMGIGRLVGNFIAGRFSHHSLQMVYASSAVLSIIAIGLLSFAFYEEAHMAPLPLPATVPPAPPIAEG